MIFASVQKEQSKPPFPFLPSTPNPPKKKENEEKNMKV